MPDLILHVHSTYSYDGELTLEQIKKQCLKRGIAIVCMTEHADDFTTEKMQRFVADCDRLSDERIRFIPGLEVTLGRTHTLMLGVRAFVGTGEIIDRLRAYKRQGAVGIIAHPHRHDFKLEAGHADVLDGVEVWNSQYDGKYLPRFEAMTLRQRLGAHMLSFAGLDMHRAAHFGGPVQRLSVVVDGEEDILNALRNGHYVLAKQSPIVTSHGEFLLRPILFWKLIGTIQIRLITAFKRLSKKLFLAGIRPPKWLKSLLRRVL